MSTESNDPDASETPNTPGPGMVSMNDLASAIGASVASAMEARDSKGRKVTFGEFQRKRNVGKTKLTRHVFQNGFQLNPSRLKNNQIELLNRLNRTGRYIERKIEVLIREDGADEFIEIRYANKSADQRMELRGYIRNFTDMLEQIVKEQDALNAAQEDRDERKAERRPFGNTKASREARAAAGV